MGFVTTAMDSTSSAQWLPGGALYQRMIDRFTASGHTSAKGVLWWQGESDAIAGVSQATYHANLASIAAAIATDLGVKMFVPKLQNVTNATAPNLAAINAAIAQAWTDVPNIAPGPDLSDIATDDGVHLISDAHVQLAASRWWTAIQTQFGW